MSRYQSSHQEELQEEGEEGKISSQNKKDNKQKKTKRDPSNVRCYTCDEKGHFARDCPIGKRRHHDHIVEDYEPTNKRFIWEKDDSDEEYVLTTTLTGTLSHEEK